MGGTTWLHVGHPSVFAGVAATAGHSWQGVMDDPSRAWSVPAQHDSGNSWKFHKWILDCLILYTFLTVVLYFLIPNIFPLLQFCPGFKTTFLDLMGRCCTPHWNPDQAPGWEVIKILFLHHKHIRTTLENTTYTLQATLKILVASRSHFSSRPWWIFPPGPAFFHGFPRPSRSSGTSVRCLPFRGGVGLEGHNSWNGATPGDTSTTFFSLHSGGSDQGFFHSGFEAGSDWNKGTYDFEHRRRSNPGIQQSLPGCKHTALWCSDSPGWFSKLGSYSEEDDHSSAWQDVFEPQTSPKSPSTGGKEEQKHGHDFDLHGHICWSLGSRTWSYRFYDTVE